MRSMIRFLRNNGLGLIIVFFIFFILLRILGIEAANMFRIRISLNTILNDFIVSFLRVSVTGLAAWLISIPCGYLILHLRCLHDLLMPAINFIRHVSPFAWFPFAIILFGLGDLSVAVIMFITLFFPAIIAAVGIFSDVQHEYRDEALVSGANFWQMFKLVELPITLAAHINLLRILWGLGWTAIIAVEMLGVSQGLGFRLLDFRYLLRYQEMILYIIIMGVTGVALDYLLRHFIRSVESKKE